MSEKVTIDLDKFTESLNRTLGWVRLQPEAPVDDETSPPSYDPDVPSIMTEFVLVPAEKYKFNYELRYIRFSYLLERDGEYEAGELSIIHDDPVSESSEDESGGSPPSEPEPFEPPTFTMDQIVTMGSVGSLGVEFSFMHDESTSGVEASYGLAFKITDDLPAVFPRLVMAYVTVITKEDV